MSYAEKLRQNAKINVPILREKAAELAGSFGREYTPSDEVLTQMIHLKLSTQTKIDYTISTIIKFLTWLSMFVQQLRIDSRTTGSITLNGLSTYSYTFYNDPKKKKTKKKESFRPLLNLNKYIYIYVKFKTSKNIFFNVMSKGYNHQIKTLTLLPP